jgi:hypothetical protein
MTLIADYPFFGEKPAKHPVKGCDIFLACVDYSKKLSLV